VDIGVTMLLITYAADMMSLFLSSISRTTTSAMTIMPFVLIFQLVFSGGIIPLPPACQGISGFTVSTYGIRAIASQSAYNEQPMVTAWKTIDGMRDSSIEKTVTVGDLLEMLNSETVAKYRDETVIPAVTAEQAAELLGMKINEEDKGELLSNPVSLGQLIDFANTDETIRQNLDQGHTIKTTVGDVLNLLGEERVKSLIQTETAEAARKPEYERSARNILINWAMLCVFIFAFAVLATVSLELIDRDKR